MALCSPLVDGLDLGEDRLSWPHPMSSSESLFVVDDATERATREVASQSRERIQATLAEMGDAAAMVARLSAEAYHRMIDEVEVQAQVSSLVLPLRHACSAVVAVV